MGLPKNLHCSGTVLQWARVAMLVVVLTTPCLQAAEITWTNEAGGDFQTAGNWNPNTVPGTNDVAVFDLAAGPYTVTWSAPITNYSLRVNQGTLTWDLQGHAYSLNRWSTNHIGSDATTVDLTITNGTVARLNPGYLGSWNYSFRLRGSGTTLRLLADGQYNSALYPYLGSGTHIIVDGSGARFGTYGYSIGCAGSIVATNGGYVSAGSGLRVQSGGDMRITGPGLRMNTGLTVYSGASARFDNDASVLCNYVKPSLIQGTLTLDDARFYYYHTTGEFRVSGASGILEGDGEVEFLKLENAGGTIRPGGTNSAGLLAFKGNFTNSVPGSGTIEIELGGQTTNDYDRMTIAAGAGGAGTLYAGGILDVTLINAFAPTNGSVFDILDFVTAVGTFDTVNLPGDDWNWITTDLYTTGEITYSVLSVMPVPTNVVASDGDYTTKVLLTWDAVAPATGYEIWRSLSADTGTATRVGTAVATTYDDTTTTAMVTNYYWIKATNATLVSTFSDGDSGWKVASLPVPAVPTNVAASDGVYMYQGKVVVTWDAAADATSYEVWRNATSDTGTATRIGTPVATTYDDTTAVANVTNYYWVKSSNPAHKSTFSDPDTGWMAPIPPFEIVWTNPAGGDFQTAANWDPPFVPTETNRAVFDLTNGPYTVTWSDSVTNSSFRVHEGTVTWDLQGHTYDMTPLETLSSIGTDSTTADLTVTNGTLRSTGIAPGNRLRPRGAGTTLRILEAEALGLPYPYLTAGTTVFVSGPNAYFNPLGYADIYGDVIVTNGARTSLNDGSRMHDNASLHIWGGSLAHAVAFSGFDADCEVSFGGGAVVNEAYVANPHRTAVKGRFTLDNARFTGLYADSWLALVDTNALLQGSGRLVYAYVENSGGAIRPGGSNGTGLLVTEGVSNAIPGSGTIHMELAGADTNDYDRLHAIAGTKGAGTFWAGGTLDVTLINGFRPTEETSFDILDFVTMEGTFDAVNVPSPVSWWVTNDLYVTGEITFIPPPAGTMFMVR